MTVADVEVHTNYVQELRRVFWPNLPMMFVSSTIVCIATVAAIALAPSVSPLSLLLWVVVIGPAFAGLVAQLDEAICGHDDPPVFSYFRYLRRSWRRGLVLGVIPAVTGGLTLVALEVYHRTGSWVALVPASISGAFTVLGLITYLVAMPITAEYATIRMRALVIASLLVVSRAPVPIIGALSVAGVIGWAAAQFSAAIILLLPGPLALVLVVAVWTSAQKVQIRPRVRERGAPD